MPNHEPRLTGTKICSKCKEEKHVFCFTSQPRKSDGLQSNCRSCHCRMNKKTPSGKKKRVESYRKKVEEMKRKTEMMGGLWIDPAR